MPRRDDRLGDILDTARAVKKTVFGMQMQMDEISHHRTSYKVYFDNLQAKVINKIRFFGGFADRKNTFSDEQSESARRGEPLKFSI